ncbi:MAG: VOC family protein [Pseudomonadota bacterium]
MAYNPVGWFEIYVQDIPRAKEFYEAVLAIEMTPLEMPGVEMFGFPMHDDVKGSSGSIIKMPDMASGGSGTLVYFTCVDCAEESGRVEAAGGTVIQPKMSIGDYGFVSLIKDPDGNMVGLHSRQ